MTNKVFVPSEERTHTKDIDVPLYIAIGLTRKQSDAVYFEYKENIVPKCKTVADALRAIIDHPKWTIPEKVWCTYNLQNVVTPGLVDKAKMILKGHASELQVG